MQPKTFTFEYVPLYRPDERIYSQQIDKTAEEAFHHAIDKFASVRVTGKSLIQVDAVSVKILDTLEVAEAVLIVCDSGKLKYVRTK